MDKNFNYRCYGLIINTNRPIPELLNTQPINTSDIKIDLSGHWPAWVNFSNQQSWALLFPAEANRPSPVYEAWCIKINNKPYLLLSYRMDDKLTFKFLIDRNNQHVYSSWTKGVSYQEIVAAILGPVLGIIMRLRSKICLHASVVVFGHHAIALVGDSGRGKSTTAAYLATYTQASILADDLAVVETKDEVDLVASGYPRLRLGSKPIAALAIETSSLSLVSALKDKYYYPLNTDKSNHRFETQSIPLSAIYLLQARSKNNESFDVAPTSTSTALLELTKHCYASYIQDEHLRKNDFRELAGLIQRVPVRSVSIPNDLENLPKSCRLLYDDWIQQTQHDRIKGNNVNVTA